MTKNLVEASRLMGIPIIDHIIVAGCTGLHCSMATMFPDLFDDIDGSRYKAAEMGAADSGERTVREGGAVPYTKDGYSSENGIGKKGRADGKNPDRGAGRGRDTGGLAKRRSLRERLAEMVTQAEGRRRDAPKRLDRAGHKAL